jgi:predicted porin
MMIIQETRLKAIAFFIAGLFAGVAHAQGSVSVSVYGIVDAAFVVESGGSGGRVNKITSGAASTSRIGFRGAERLGGDLSAFFTLETGTRIDTGALDADNTLFNRQALVGLKSSAGSVALGRQYTPYYLAISGVVDPFGAGYAGSSKSLFPANGSNVRTSNTITYASPTLHGVDMQLAYSLGEQSDSSAGRQYGGAIGYAQGPLTVRLAYNARNSDVVSGASPVDHDLGRNILLGANYDFGWVRLYAGYGIDKGFDSAPLPNANAYGGLRATPSTDSRNVLLGLKAPFGPGTLMFSLMYKNDRTAFDQDAGAVGLGYLYPLSKRTELYAAYGHIRNHNGAGYTVANNSESGSGSTAYNLGIRHSF